MHHFYYHTNLYVNKMGFLLLFSLIFQVQY